VAGSPNTTSGIPVEALSLPGTPAESPVADVNDIQAQAFINLCHRQRMSDEGMQKCLREHGISEVAKIPIAKGRACWNGVRRPETAQPDP
jgi:hypothetical protein